MAKYVLMNKNKEIALIEYSKELSTIISIDELYSIEYAPLGVYNAKLRNESMLKAMNIWFKGRGIPSWRDNLYSLVTNLGIDTPEELLDKAFALSLSDQYWIKPEKENISWSQVNFFENDFDSTDFTNATFGKLRKKRNINFHTPNNTCDGMLRKTWIIDNEERFLLKSGFRHGYQEPLNERLSSIICEALGFDYVNYEVARYKDNILSLCKCFITPDTELISANDIYFSKKKPEHLNDYEHYISILEAGGISDARRQMENMLVLDCLVMNEDRHTRNFGIIRNVETLKWERVAPIFDTGQSMNSQNEYLGFDFSCGYGKLFYDTHCNFETFLPLVQDIARFDAYKLSPIISSWRELLLCWQDNSGMDDNKIKALVDGLQLRIEKFEEYIEQSS